MAWASFSGIQDYFNKQTSQQKHDLGIINFDAHLDLRNPKPVTSSGKPLREIAAYCQSVNKPFNYCVLGYSPCANTSALMQFADNNGVLCIEDADCNLSYKTDIAKKLEGYIRSLDYLYITLCLDVFSAAHAPGVSAPAAFGIDPGFVIQMIRLIKQLCNTYSVKIILVDIAEMNPQFDREGMTSKLAGRLIHELLIEAPDK